ncbi:MAG: hypothetical protein U0871_18080 [Gemmataceae bacterium]
MDPQAAEWLEHVRAKRAEVRQQRADADAARTQADRHAAQTDRLRHAARADRVRAKQLYARFKERMRREEAAAQAARAAERENLAEDRRRFADEVKRFRAEQARFHEDALASRDRLNRGWALLTDGQRRLLADRQEAERTVAAEQAAVEQRAADLAAEVDRLTGARDRTEARVADLLTEIARLDARAVAARAVVQQLEERRAALEGELAPPRADAGPMVFVNSVPLDLPAGENALQLMADLTDKERDLARERAGLTAARVELEKRAAELYDQRLVLAEQVEAVTLARHAWQATECQTVAELEQMARVVCDRENAVDARGRQVARAEQRVREREAELVEFRAKLEGWQAALTAHEAALASTRDKAVAELTARRDQLHRWEVSLTDLSRRWSADRRREIDTLRSELAACVEARQRYTGLLADLNRDRAELTDRAAAVAGRAVAVEAATAALADGPQQKRAERKLRLAGKKWEAHFARAGQELDARRRSLAAEADRADDRCREWARVAADAAERGQAAADAERLVEAERLTRTRELDERAADLAVKLEQSQRTAQELTAVRTEVARLAAALIDRAPEALPVPELVPEVLALQPA